MNIFYTHPDPLEAAAEHCYVHQTKMILEYAQMLSTAHRVLDGYGGQLLYKSTHENHPSNVWLRESRANYQWLYACWTELLRLRRQRTGKPATERVQAMARLLERAPYAIKDRGPTPIRVAINRTEWPVPEHLPPAEQYQLYLNMKFAWWLTRTDKRRMPVEFDAVPSWCKHHGVPEPI